MTCSVFFGLNLPSGSELGKGRGTVVTGRKTVILARQALLLGLTLCFAIAVLSRTAAANPAQMISDFRLKHGEKRVTLDATLTRIAHDQAQAMAAKDQLDHDVLGRFNSRVSPAGAGRAAENIAYGYDGFPKTLDQWINSSGHRKNLLLPGATRVGVASVKSAKTGRMYWAMVIAGDYERKAPKSSPKSSPKDSRQASAAKPKLRAAETCRLKILSICF
ncbi:CAP domain-containing protein [Bradyrhizobium sp. 200]|nr:CAP domain-containing protein [Bradyrhizobium sp. 200]